MDAFSMNNLMYRKSTLITKWFSTHITEIRTLSSVDTLMSIQSTPLGKGVYHTHHRCKDALQYEHFHVLWGHSDRWNLYHTKCRNMDSHYYAWTHVLSKSSGNGITHYTHHSDMVTPQYEWRYGASIHVDLKWFVTNFTCKWTHTTKHSLMMALQITLRSKRLFTHITAIWMVTTV